MRKASLLSILTYSLISVFYTPYCVEIIANPMSGNDWSQVFKNISNIPNIPNIPSNPIKTKSYKEVAPKSKGQQYSSVGIVNLEEIANTTVDLLKGSLSAKKLNIIKDKLSAGNQITINSNGWAKTHNHENNKNAELHVTLCNNCSEKGKCKTNTSCKIPESYNELQLPGKIQIYTDTKGEYKTNNTLIIDIEDKDKKLNGSGDSFHIKLIQWLPKELDNALRAILEKKPASINIKFKNKPVYADSFYQTSNQTHDCNQRKINGNDYSYSYHYKH